MKFIPFTIRDRAMRMSGWESGAGDGQHVEDEMVRYHIIYDTVGRTVRR